MWCDMAKDEFDIGQMIGSLGASIESLKEAMTRQHGELTAQISMTILGQKEMDKSIALIDKSNTKAHERIDDHAANLIHIKDLAEKALKLGEDLENSKKKIIWTIGGVSIGASFAGSKIANFISGLFQ